MDVLDLKAKLTLDTEGYESDLSKTAGSTAKTLNEDAKKAGKSTGSSFFSALKPTFTISAQDIIKAGKAMWAAVENAAAYGDEIDKMSQKMGISAEAYQEWDAVMEHSGTSMSALQSGMKTLANAVESGNSAFQRLGITQEEIASMNQEQLFSRTISALQDVKDTTERTYLAGQLLGRGATELGALLNTSAEDTQAMKDRLHELGGVMTDEGVKASAQFEDNMQDLKTALSGLGRDIVTDALPAVNDMVTGLTNLVVGFREWRNLGWDSNISTFEDAAANVQYWTDKVNDAQGAIDAFGVEGAAFQLGEYNRALGNAQEQLDALMASEEVQADLLARLSSGELSITEAAQMAGISTQEMSRRMRVAADAQRTAASSAEDTAEEIGEEEIAAMLAADELSNLVRETQYAARGNGDLRAEYEELEKQISALSGVEDEHLQDLAEMALRTLDLAATNQELTEGYGYYTDVLSSMGGSVSELTEYLVDNGISAEQWGSAVTNATNSVINGFQRANTSIGLSITEMAANLQANIEAQANWNTNIATLMAAAEASGDASKIAFVQHMQEMGVGAADQVAAMVEDVDGTLDTFGPLFEEAAEQGVITATTALTDGAVDVSGTAEDVMADSAEAAEGIAEAEGPGIGQALVDGMASGMIKASAQAIATAEQVTDGIVGAVKMRAQIQSPSKVMRDEVGLMLTEGIAVGMTDREALSQIDDAAGDIAGYVTSAFSGIPASGTYEYGASASTASVGASGGSMEILSLLQMYLPLLERPITIDGEALVGATASAMDQQLGTRTTYAGRGLAI